MVYPIISIHTRSTSLLSKEFWKWVARRGIGKYSGPNAVEDSLLRGLRQLNIPFKRNVWTAGGEVVIVLSGTVALSEAIAHKRAGRIKKIIAGPNIAIFPLEDGQILSSPEVDVVLVPAKWVRDLWLQAAPELAPKLAVWASGVEIATASKRTGRAIIYNKLNDDSLLTDVRATIGDCVVFDYGNFKRKDYLTALETAPFVVYLSQSESQGLALQEAWAHDVPTFVNKSTSWTNGKTVFEADKINAPYLTDELGGIFDSMAELTKLTEISATFKPKAYCDKHLSDQASARNLLDIIYEKNN